MTAEETQAEPRVIRQWVSAPGGSCDVRLGDDLLNQLGPILRSAVGKPHKCGLLCQEGTDADLIEKVRRELTSAGFLVEQMSLKKEKVRDVAELPTLYKQFKDAGLSQDDLLICIADADGLSLACHAANTWTGGLPLAALTTTIADSIEIVVTPRSLDVDGTERLMNSHGTCKYLLCDSSLIAADLASDTEEAQLARAYMVSSAMADSERAFQELWDRADELMEGSKEVMFDQAIETLKSRGKLCSSSSVAIRQSLNYGEVFAAALQQLADVPKGIGLAEGLRFAARLAYASDKLSLDDLKTQDELLDMLKLPSCSVDITPEALISALKEECLKRQGRFMLELPQVIGRVRLSSLEDELLFEHASAWCAAHRK